MTEKKLHCDEQKLPVQRELSAKQTVGPQKIFLKETIIVEGRYDKIKLSECIASPIIETGGFRVFKDKEKQQLIRAIAQRRGILVMTDVDSAGFVIRNFLRGIVPEEKLLHAYIPTIAGKEKRKPETSKEGILGVEGIDREALLDAIRKSGARIISEIDSNSPFPEEGGAEYRRVELDNKTERMAGEITKLDFYDYGLTGTDNAAQKRQEILSALGLPRYLTANAMLSATNSLFTKDEFEEYLSQLNPDKS